MSFYSRRLTGLVARQVGLFAVGSVPSATADPFGLRRAAYGLVQALIANNVQVDLKEASGICAKLLPVECDSEVQGKMLEFVERRLEQLFLDLGYTSEVVRAVLAERGSNPCAVRSRLMFRCESTFHCLLVDTPVGGSDGKGPTERSQQRELLRNHGSYCEGNSSSARQGSYGRH